jgi:hypothetical protein
VGDSLPLFFEKLLKFSNFSNLFSMHLVHARTNVTKISMAYPKGQMKVKKASARPTERGEFAPPPLLPFFKVAGNFWIFKILENSIRLLQQWQRFTKKLFVTPN